MISYGQGKFCQCHTSTWYNLQNGSQDHIKYGTICMGVLKTITSGACIGWAHALYNRVPKCFFLQNTKFIWHQTKCKPFQICWLKLDIEVFRYIPNIKRTLISMWQLDDEGACGYFDVINRQWKLTKRIQFYWIYVQITNSLLFVNLLIICKPTKSHTKNINKDME